MDGIVQMTHLELTSSALWICNKKKIKQTSPWQMRQQQKQAEELQKPQNEVRGALTRASILCALKDHYGD
jgi:hypothetical protein